MSCRLQLYGFEHVPARYIGILAAGDAKLEVAEAGRAALRPPKPTAAGACRAGISEWTEFPTCWRKPTPCAAGCQCFVGLLSIS